MVFFIITALIPLVAECSALPKWHNQDNVVDGTIEYRVFEQQIGIVMFGNHRYNVLNNFPDNWTLPVVFGLLGEQKSSTKSEDTSYNCKYKIVVETQWALLSILIGGIIGNYLGALYSLRYLSNSNFYTSSTFS